MRVLVEEGVVKVNYQSNSTTTYAVQDPELAKQALEAIGDGQVQEGHIHPDLFD